MESAAETWFLFIDERKPCTYGEVIALTGIAFPSSASRALRDEILAAYRKHSAERPDVIDSSARLEMKSLLPRADDAARIAFCEDIERTILDIVAEIYRYGLVYTNDLARFFKIRNSLELMALLFVGLLDMYKIRSSVRFTWLVVERDGTRLQERAFAGTKRLADIMQHAFPAAVSTNALGLCDVLFCTKESWFGFLPDYASYMRNIAMLADGETRLSPFKRKLLPVAKKLDSVTYELVDQWKFDGGRGCVARRTGVRFGRRINERCG